MVRYQITDEAVRLLNLIVEDSTIVQALPLDHFSMMNANTEKKEVHNLAHSDQEHLLIEDLLSVDNAETNHEQYVEAVDNDELPKEYVPHEEQQ
jgi:hypothetical protein